MTESVDNFDITTVQFLYVHAITDFELSGENIKTEVMFLLNIYLFHCLYVDISTHAKEQTSSIRKSYLRTNIFLKRFNLV